MAGLEEERTLKDEIISELVDEEQSISGLQKSLETRGIKAHRLVLSGYLKALVDIGLLKEKEIKPSRIYSVQNTQGKDLYEMAGIVSRKFSQENTGDNALELLFFLFNRPVFIREIERCNVDLPRNYKSVVPQRRLEYIARLNDQGIKIPQNNIMMEPVSRDNQKLIKMLRDLVNISVDLKKYIMPDQDNTQTTLD